MNQLALIGLGRMGGNMARRLARAGIAVAVHNRTPEVAQRLAAEEAHAQAYARIEDMLASVKRPRIVWLMLPAGAATEGTLETLAPLLDAEDLVVNGANAYYRDSLAQAARLAEKGIDYVDAGVSGGVWGLSNGYALMLGGRAQAVARLQPVIAALAPAADQGWVHCGPVGSGHYAKMVHNGIEYGMMQSLAEGFAVLKKSQYKLDLGNVAEIYNNGSVIESRLVGWMKGAFETYGADMKKVSGTVAHTGEGQWTVQTAKSLKVPAPVIGASFKFRVDSAKKPSYTGKLLSALRNQFGGHAVK